MKRAGPDTPDDMAVYFPVTAMGVVVRSKASGPGAVEEVKTAIQSTVSSIDKDAVVTDTRTMNLILDSALLQKRFVLLLVSIFAGIALVLATVGMFGVVSYTAATRAKEIGIRIALGARRTSIFLLVVGEAVRLAIGGIALGLASAFALTRLMDSFLFKTSPVDPYVFILASLLTLLISVAASYLPARRATGPSPYLALRQD